jgi:hypothetical protein
MKKLVMAAAVFSGLSLFGMEGGSPVSNEFDTYVRGWATEVTSPLSEREERDYDDFSTQPFKERLLKEIGDDQAALKAFELFHAHDFVELWKHWKENKGHMLPDNAARFLDLSALAAPIININESDRIYVKEIVDTVGSKSYVDYYMPKFPQFCCEMFFCIAWDTDQNDCCKNQNELLSRLCKKVSANIANHQEWVLSKEMLKLMILFGCGEDIGEMHCKFDFYIKWIDGKDSTK